MINFIAILERAFPTRCIICDKTINHFVVCNSCLAKIKPIESHCLKCGLSLKTGFHEFCGNCIDKKMYMDEMWSLYDYRDISPIILSLKLRRSLRAKKAMEQLIKYAFLMRENQQVYNLDGINCVTFIPIHWKKRFVREFNQAEIIANIVGKLLDKPVKKMLIKTKSTEDQTALPKEKRKSNVKNTFKAINKPEGGIILVDDVATTLSTLNEAAKTLKRAGANKIIGLCVARSSYV